MSEKTLTPIDAGRDEPTTPMVQLPEGTLLPVCPYCGTDPADITALQITAPTGAVQAILYCANPECRKIFNIQIIGLPAPKQPRIATPGQPGWLG